MPERPSKLMPALYGGIIMGVISGVPVLNLVNCLCCAGILLGGFMAVFFYKKDLTPGSPLLTSGDAIQLGALAGVVGAILESIFTAVTMMAVGNIGGETIYNLLDSMGITKQMPPEALDQMEQGLKEAHLSALSVVTNFIICPLFGLLGGLIGYAVYKPKPGAMPPPVVQTPA